MRLFCKALLLGLMAALVCGPALAAETTAPMTLQDCLKKTESVPDLAVADAEMWAKHNGGVDARLCHAVGQFRRGDYAKAAEEFHMLAVSGDIADPKKKAALISQSAAAYVRAQKYDAAEREYTIALKVADDDPDILIDRSLERAAAQRYWDAISDLNTVLKSDPRNVTALRTRGQVWIKLGNQPMAQNDFLAAENIEPSPAAAPAPSPQ